ncbi:MAG: MFS transporter [Acidobacteria bacterium]|nr:MFS transporter [Acidobacteriota bacterium]
MASSPPLVPPLPPSAETPESPAARVPLDWLLAPGRGWFRALRHAEFRVFWAGNLVSNVGSWMQNVAQGWLVLQLTGSPLWLGLVGFAQQVPALVFSLLGGVIADRASRRRLLLAVVGGAMVNCVATVLSLIQTLVPDQIRGRVLSMHTMAFLSFTPLGSLLVGALAEHWGTPAALGLSSGLALVLTAMIALAAPSVRHLK